MNILQVIKYTKWVLWVLRKWEQYKAWRRGEVMSKTVTRGRCFAKKGEATLEVTPESETDKQSLGEVSVRPKVTMKLTGIKVIRKDGTVEEIDHG